MLEQRTLGENAYIALRDWIVAGKFVPGERLMYDQLARELGISHSPLKEAFLRLEREGLVDLIPRRGTYVKRMGADEIAELYQIREVLEGLSARLASENATEDDINELKEHSHNLEICINNKNPEGCVQADIAFHNCLLRIAGNDHLIDMVRTHLLTNLFAAANQRIKYLEIGSESVERHRGVIDAIESRDPEAAESRMRGQIRSGAKKILSDFNTHVESNQIDPITSR